MNILESNPCYLILTETTISLLHYVKCGSFGPIWDLYLGEIENMINDTSGKLDLNGREEMPETSKLIIGLNLSLVCICLTVHKGNLVNGKNMIVKIKKKIYICIYKN